MAELEITLRKNGERAGRIIYELTNEASGEATRTIEANADLREERYPPILQSPERVAL